MIQIKSDIIDNIYYINFIMVDISCFFSWFAQLKWGASYMPSNMVLDVGNLLN